MPTDCVIVLVDDNEDALEDGAMILGGILDGREAPVENVHIVKARDDAEARAVLAKLEPLSDIRCLLIIDGLNGLGLPLLEEMVAKLGDRAAVRLLLSGDDSLADPEPHARLNRIQASFLLKGGGNVFDVLVTCVNQLLHGVL